MSFLKKVQDQPVHIRKMILWTILVIIAAGLIIVWFVSMRQSMNDLKQHEIINTEALEQEIGEFPDFLPEISDEELEEFEQKIKELE